MSYQCQHCHKGVGYGHAVSHAKNRIRRLFKPNLQKLKVFLNGKISLRVKFCTSCIKRLKKDGRLGNLYCKKIIPAVTTKAAPIKVTKTVEKKIKLKKILPKEEAPKEIPKETPKLDIDAIVGKKK